MAQFAVPLTSTPIKLDDDSRLSAGTRYIVQNKSNEPLWFYDGADAPAAGDGDVWQSINPLGWGDLNLNSTWCRTLSLPGNLVLNEPA